MTKLKIALFFNLPSGGAKRAIYEWVRRPSNWTIDVFTLSTADHEFLDLRPWVQQYNVSEFTTHRLFHHPFGRLNQAQRLRDLGSLSRINESIASKINQGGYDLAFVQPCIFTYIPELVSHLRIPSVYYLHEPLETTAWNRINRPYLGSDETLREKIDKVDPLIALYQQRLRNIRFQALHSVTRVLANSRFTQQQTLKSFGVESDVSYLGVDTESFQPSPQIERDYAVISVGEMVPRKGFDFLIESLAYIPVIQRPYLKLVCNRIDLNEKKYLESLAFERGVRLIIFERLNTEELAKAFKSSLFCVYAPVEEPFGLVPLEAMACGLPVVGVNEGGIAETVIPGVTGLLVDRDPKEFAKAVWSLLENPGLSAVLSRKARAQTLQNWSWEKSIEQLHGHFERIIVNKNSNGNKMGKVNLYG